MEALQVRTCMDSLKQGSWIFLLSTGYSDVLYLTSYV
jgi:hypothetical protein